jgi:hypothetical protein
MFGIKRDRKDNEAVGDFPDKYGQGPTRGRVKRTIGLHLARKKGLFLRWEKRKKGACGKKHRKNLASY